MGGTSSEGTETQQQTQTHTPSPMAYPILSGLLGQVGALPNAGPTGTQNTAFNNLVGLGQAGNPYASGIGNVATSMLSGGPDRTGIASDAYSQYQKLINPTAQGDYLDPNKNPFFGATTSGIYDKAMEGLNKSYAAAGVSPTGAGSYGQKMGETVTNALAPQFMNQYNQERTNQLGAIQNLYGAGNQTAGLLSGLDTQKFANQQGGIGASGAAMDAQMWGPQQVIQAEAARQGITTDELAKRMGITMPAAQAFGTTTSTGTTDKQMETGTNWGQLAVGAGTAAALFF